ncbi:uncharacterized protein MELLADRAFT_101267 [Melampsora larici-populina 98AG31]|uniref:Secreted protein n=1 Tax=Melampsora larici-populina (strain 98AG31 / pathotype 3-4-7) TaxID=747676 RepID=F4R462_MELLP|nr:uncharacterized protein MELLADRAFT_101267 [Melampsora larici-populina 98AG31]EGG12749.1 hypothetical protein MELLADRAFT_101267 [Melampsora larici-populina 98AG31]
MLIRAMGNASLIVLLIISFSVVLLEIRAYEDLGNRTMHEAARKSAGGDDAGHLTPLRSPDLRQPYPCKQWKAYIQGYHIPFAGMSSDDLERDQYMALKRLLGMKKNELARYPKSDLLKILVYLSRQLEKAHARFAAKRRKASVKGKKRRRVKKLNLYLRSLTPFFQRMNTIFSQYNDTPSFRGTQMPSLSCMTMRYLLSYGDPGLEELEMSNREARVGLEIGVTGLFSHCRTSDLPPNKSSTTKYHKIN